MNEPPLPRTSLPHFSRSFHPLFLPRHPLSPDPPPPPEGTPRVLWRTVGSHFLPTDPLFTRHNTQTEEAEEEGDVERLRGQSQIEWMSVEEHLSLSLPRSVVSGGVAGGSRTRGTVGVEFLGVVGGGAIRGPSRVPGNNRHPQLLHPPAGKRTESLHSLLLIHPLGVLVVDLVWEEEGEDGEGKRKENLKLLFSFTIFGCFLILSLHSLYC